MRYLWLGSALLLVAALAGCIGGTDDAGAHQTPPEGGSEQLDTWLDHREAQLVDHGAGSANGNGANHQPDTPGDTTSTLDPSPTAGQQDASAGDDGSQGTAGPGGSDGSDGGDGGDGGDDGDGEDGNDTILDDPLSDDDSGDNDLQSTGDELPDDPTGTTEDPDQTLDDPGGTVEETTGVEGSDVDTVSDDDGSDDSLLG